MGEGVCLMATGFDSFDTSALGARIQSAVDGTGAFGSSATPGPIYILGTSLFYSWDPDSGDAPDSLASLPSGTFRQATVYNDVLHILLTVFDGGFKSRVFEYTSGSWSQIGDLDAYSTLTSITEHDGTLYVNGTSGLLHLSSGAWVSDGTGTNHARIKSAGGILWGIGRQGTSSTAQLYKWTGSSWVPAPGGTNWAGDIIEVGGTLYTAATGVAVTEIRASTDDFLTWSVLSSAGESAATAIELTTMRLAYLSGSFYYWHDIDGITLTQGARLAIYDGSTTENASSALRLAYTTYTLLVRDGKLYTCGPIGQNQVHTASIDSVGSPPSGGTFRVTVSGSYEEVTGDTDPATTASNLVDALNASVNASIAALTWAADGASITGSVDLEGNTASPSLTVTGTGTVTNFVETTDEKIVGTFRWSGSAWVQLTTQDGRDLVS